MPITVTEAESSIWEYSLLALTVLMMSSLWQSRRAVSLAVSGESQRNTASSQGWSEVDIKSAISSHPERIGGGDPFPKREAITRSSRYSGFPSGALRSYILPAGRPISESISAKSTSRHEVGFLSAQEGSAKKQKTRHKIKILFILIHLFSFSAIYEKKGKIITAP